MSNRSNMPILIWSFSLFFFSEEINSIFKSFIKSFTLAESVQPRSDKTQKRTVSNNAGRYNWAIIPKIKDPNHGKDLPDGICADNRKTIGAECNSF